VIVGDVPQDIFNKNGTAFHLKLPEGYLFYENDNDNNSTGRKYKGGAWEMTGFGGVTLSAGHGEYANGYRTKGETLNSWAQPRCFPYDFEKNFIAVSGGGQITLNVVGKPISGSGLYTTHTIILNNLDDGVGGANLKLGLDMMGSKSVIIELSTNSTGSSRSIKLGEDAVDPVVRKSDLQKWITQTFDTHTHATAAPGPPIVPSNAGSQASGSDLVYAK
jgi:hypothetical protein